MNNKNINTNVGAKIKKRNKNRFFLIFICIFLTVVLVAGLILGVIAYVNKKNSVASYGFYMLDVGEANYFASYFKYRFLVGLSDSGIEAYDTEAFWASESESGDTYGELLKKGFSEFLSGILVANALFDRYSRLESEDKEYINSFLDGVIAREGSEEKFNAAAAEYGFDYKDYETAVEYIYKATMAQRAIFGVDGANLSAFPEECAEFYENNYSRVSLLFLRDEMILETDDMGIVTERPITAEEKATREGYADRLRTAIYNSQNGVNGPLMTPEMYEYYYRLSDSDMDMYRNYYFAENAEATAEFATQFPQVTQKALSMKKGEYAEVECSIGTCFIYKEELAESGYTDKNNPFFSDFYSDAVYGIYSNMLALYAEDVEFSEKYSEVDIFSLPKNYRFAVSIIR